MTKSQSMSWELFTLFLSFGVNCMFETNAQIAQNSDIHVYLKLAALEERLIRQEATIANHERSIKSLTETVKKQHDKVQQQEKVVTTLQALLGETLSTQDDRKQEQFDRLSSDVNLDRSKENNSIPKNNAVNHKIIHRQIEGAAIAFTVYLDHDVDTGAGQTIKFNQVITNEGSGYNIHTGVFTCPESGMYLFSFSVGTRDIHQVAAYLQVNSKNVIDAVAETTGNAVDNQGSNSVVIRLNVGDSVWITSAINHHAEGSEFRITSFTGVYLYN